MKIKDFRESEQKKFIDFINSEMPKFKKFADKHFDALGKDEEFLQAFNGTKEQYHNLNVKAARLYLKIIYMNYFSAKTKKTSFYNKNFQQDFNINYNALLCDFINVLKALNIKNFSQCKAYVAVIKYFIYDALQNESPSSAQPPFLNINKIRVSLDEIIEMLSNDYGIQYMIHNSDLELFAKIIISKIDDAKLNLRNLPNINSNSTTIDNLNAYQNNTERAQALSSKLLSSHKIYLQSKDDLLLDHFEVLLDLLKSHYDCSVNSKDCLFLSCLYASSNLNNFVDRLINNLEGGIDENVK